MVDGGTVPTTGFVNVGVNVGDQEQSCVVVSGVWNALYFQFAL